MSFTWTKLFNKGSAEKPGGDMASVDPINKIGEYLELVEGSLYEPIKTITLTEAVSAVTIDADIDGNAFELRKAKLRVYLPALPSNNMALRGKINNLSSNYCCSTSYGLSYAQFGTGSTVCSLNETEINLFVNGDIMARSYSEYVAASTCASAAYYNILYGASLSNINALYLYLATGNLPIGTTIELEGVRI